MNDPLDVGKPDSGAFELVAAVQALENPEQLFRILHVEADTVVTDGNHHLAIVAGLGDD